MNATVKYFRRNTNEVRVMHAECRTLATYSLNESNHICAYCEKVNPRRIAARMTPYNPVVEFDAINSETITFG